MKYIPLLSQSGVNIMHRILVTFCVVYSFALGNKYGEYGLSQPNYGQRRQAGELDSATSEEKTYKASVTAEDERNDSNEPSLTAEDNRNDANEESLTAENPGNNADEASLTAEDPGNDANETSLTEEDPDDNNVDEASLTREDPGNDANEPSLTAEDTRNDANEESLTKEDTGNNANEPSLTQEDFRHDDPSLTVEDNSNSPISPYIFDEKRYKVELAAGDPTEFRSGNQHYHEPHFYANLGRRFVPVYPYTEVKEKFKNMQEEDLMPRWAPKKVVLAVMKEAIKNSPAPSPSEDFTRQNILRSGDYFDGVWKEEIKPENILRTNKINRHRHDKNKDELNSLPITAKLIPGSKLYNLISGVVRQSPRLVYIINDE